MKSLAQYEIAGGRVIWDAVQASSKKSSAILGISALRGEADIRDPLSNVC